MTPSTNPVAIVTGASSGIGEAAARTLRAHGFEVYAVARRTEAMAPLEEAGIRVVGLDVTDDAALVALVERVASEHGRIDVVVNNAGYGLYGAVEDVPIDQARRQLEVNLVAVARLTQLVLPHMRARRSGRVVNVSSVGGRLSEPLGGWYHASKFGLEALSDALRMEVRQFGIAVSVVQPGAITTEWGGIASEAMLENSGATAYGPLARSMARWHARNYRSGAAVGPRAVADVILEAATATRPRARYAVPFTARLLLSAVKHLPTTALDVAHRVVAPPR